MPNKSQVGTSIPPRGSIRFRCCSNFPAAKHGDNDPVRSNLENEEKQARLQRERRAKTNIDAFLQHTSIGQRRDYLARGQRFGTLDGGQLRESWIIAVRNWLARKDRAAELTMDDLTAELRLRGHEPPYDAVKQELATRFGRISDVAQKKAGREFARQIDMFRRENDKPLH